MEIARSDRPRPVQFGLRSLMIAVAFAGCLSAVVRSGLIPKQPKWRCLLTDSDFDRFEDPSLSRFKDPFDFDRPPAPEDPVCQCPSQGIPMGVMRNEFAALEKAP